MTLRILGTIPLLALLAGCVGGAVRIGGVQHTNAYDPSLVQTAARSGEIPVVVRGMPFHGEAGAPSAVVAALPMPGWVGAARFVPSSDPSKNADYRMVLAFGTADALPCAALSDRADDSSGGDMHVQASFCAGRQLIATLNAAGPPVTNATDPQFRQMMGQLIAILLPASNADQAHDSGSGSGSGSGGGGGGSGGM
jgi:hypothetical protein